MELPEDDRSFDRNDSGNGLDNLSNVMAPESLKKSQLSKGTKDDKKKKKKRDKSEKGDGHARKLKVKDLGDAGADNASNEDIDDIIKQQKNKFGVDNSDAGSALGQSQKGGKGLHATATNFNKGGIEAGAQRGNFLGESMGSEYGQRMPNHGGQKKFHQTLEPGDDNLSQGRISEGGTRYVVNFKTGIKFYGNQGESGANLDVVS